jgi:hypothetical protein
MKLLCPPASALAQALARRVTTSDARSFNSGCIRLRYSKNVSSPLRPASIYLVSFWSLIRGLLVALSLYGEFVFLEAALGYGVGNLTFFELWALSPGLTKIGIVFSTLQIFAFFIFTIGIIRGDNWSRLGFIIVSIAILIWKTFGVISTGLALGYFEHLHQILYNLLGVSIAIWYFDQHHILKYFGVKQRLFDWTYQRLFGYPRILIIILGLSGVIIVSELLGLGGVASLLYFN